MSQAAEQLEVEICNVIDRHFLESELTMLDLIIALERVKISRVKVQWHHANRNKEQKNECEIKVENSKLC